MTNGTRGASFNLAMFNNVYTSIFLSFVSFRNLGNNELVTLENNQFVGLTQLRDLTLSHNYIQYVPEDAFVGLIHLQYL